jgi:hypothetical protein
LASAFASICYRPTTRRRVDLPYPHIFSPRVSQERGPGQWRRTGRQLPGVRRPVRLQVTYDIDWTFSDPFGQPVED